MTRSNEIHAVVVFHGSLADPRWSLAAFFEYAQALMQEYHCPISLIGHSKSQKHLSYSRLKKKMGQICAESDRLSLNSLTEGVTYASENYSAYLNMNFQKERRLSIDFVASLLDIQTESFLRIAEYVIRTWSPKYGYGYRRPLVYGPDLYASYLGGEKIYPYEEGGRITQWYDATMEDRFLRNAWLREVYPWNFVTDVHLNAPVGKVSLRDWIQQGPDRGTLSPLSNEMWLWDVPPERCRALDEQLLAAGRVFDYMRDIVAKLPPGPAMTMEEVTGQVLQGYGFDSPAEVEIRKGDNQPLAPGEKKKLFKKKPRPGGDTARGN